MVMEYFEAGSVVDIIEATGKALQENLIFNILSQVLKGLEYLHSHKIVHKSVKVLGEN